MTTAIAEKGMGRKKGMKCDKCGNRSEHMTLVREGDEALQICPECVAKKKGKTNTNHEPKIRTIRGNPEVFAQLGARGQWAKEANSLTDEQLAKIKTVKDFNSLAYYTRFFTISKLTDIKLLEDIAKNTGDYLKKKVLKRISALKAPAKTVDALEQAKTDEAPKAKKSTKKTA
jgi:hypothetical protein